MYKFKGSFIFYGFHLSTSCMLSVCSVLRSVQLGWISECHDQVHLQIDPKVDNWLQVLGQSSMAGVWHSDLTMSCKSHCCWYCLCCFTEREGVLCPGVWWAAMLSCSMSDWDSDGRGRSCCLSWRLVGQCWRSNYCHQLLLVWSSS